MPFNVYQALQTIRRQTSVLQEQDCTTNVQPVRYEDNVPVFELTIPLLNQKVVEIIVPDDKDIPQ